MLNTKVLNTKVKGIMDMIKTTCSGYNLVASFLNITFGFSDPKSILL